MNTFAGRPGPACQLPPDQYAYPDARNRSRTGAITARRST